MTVEPVLLYDRVVTLHLVCVVIVVYCLHALAHVLLVGVSKGRWALIYLRMMLVHLPFMGVANV